MRKIKILFICFILLSTSLVYAKDNVGGSLEQKAKVLEKLLKQFESLCLDSKGEILEKTIIVDREAVMNDGQVLSCHEESIRLAKMINELQSESTNIEQTKTSLAGAECVEINGVKVPIGSQELMLAKSAENLSKKMQQDQCQKQTSSDCTADITCNIVRATLAQPTKLLSFIPEKNRPQVPKCIEGKQGDCITEFFNGIIQDLWSNVTGVWDLAKLAAGAVKKTVIESWNMLSAVEDKTSNAALAASKQSDGALEKFKKDPMGFIKDVALEIWEMMNQAIKDNFGCEKWEAIPHFSKCVSPMSNWNCASCGQKMNAVCGVAGVLGGEVVAAWLTGGAVSLGAKAAGKGSAYMGKINEALIKAIPAVEKVEKGMAKVAKTMVVLPITKTIDFARKIIQSQLSVKILDYAKKASQPSMNALLKLSRTKPMTLTVKVVKGAVSPVTSYMKLLDNSFDAGMLAADRAVNKLAQKMSKFSTVMKDNEKLGMVDDIVLNTKTVDGISPEVVGAKFKEKGISYEEVKFPDGSVGKRIKVDPSCPIHGGRSVLIK